MTCQECNKRPATLHFTKIINGEKTEFHICEVCARERGEIIAGTNNGFSIHNLLSGLLQFEAPGMPQMEDVQASQQQLRCENCGLTYGQFRKIGRFGCSSCYDAFGASLDGLLRRVQHNTEHSGKVPSRSGGKIQCKREIDQIRKEMQQWIEQEEFEKAAEMRDRIRELERKLADI